MHNTSCCISVLSRFLSHSITHSFTHIHTCNTYTIHIQYAYTAYIGCTHALEYRINDLACGSLYKSAVRACLSFCVCLCRHVKFKRRLLNHSCIFAHSLSSDSSHTLFLFSYGTLQDLTCTLTEYSRVVCCVLCSTRSTKGRCL